jgi:hypothetical protein
MVRRVCIAQNLPETAIRETRPEPGERISVCEFRTAIQLRVVNLEVTRLKPVGLGVAQDVFNYLTFRMAEPVEEMPNDGKYVPTQMIAELCRAEGFEGLSYTSVAHGSGKNVGVFSPDSLCFIESRLV